MIPSIAQASIVPLESPRSWWPDFWSAPEWTVPSAAIGIVLLVLLGWSWQHSRAGLGTASLGISAKAIAIALLLSILLEPMSETKTVEPRANLFLLLADNSHSLTTTGPDESRTWSEQLRETLDPLREWRQKLDSDFDVQTMTFDRKLDQVSTFDGLSGDGVRSDLHRAIGATSERFADRPVAGLLLLSDGIATDTFAELRAASPTPFPVFPVVFGSDNASPDLRITRVSTSETNFEAAPVTVAAEFVADGFAGQTIIATLVNSQGEVQDKQKVANVVDAIPFAVQFKIKPEPGGVQFYKVVASVDREGPGQVPNDLSDANNTRSIVVNRSGGPYRVLYVSGRPNWEYKFLRRSLETDEEVDLVGLVRIAKKQPKFTFRSRDSESNPLFRGFDSDEEQAEAYDEPVMLRVGTEDADELRGGFPETAEELFRYHAVILDDIEAAFFTQDQKDLLNRFVSQRGGGLLMLGGQESFQGGGYARTSIGEMLPVYADRPVSDAQSENYRLKLTREGWLESWTRLRPTEKEESSRLEALPDFETINRLASIKPGARVLAEIVTPDDVAHPALVTQPFGRGKTGALLIGDLWKWHLGRTSPESKDFEQGWRQTVRWLVAEVPKRVEIRQNNSRSSAESFLYQITVRDEEFRLLDNAGVFLTVTDPSGQAVTIQAVPSPEVSGEYVVSVRPKEIGPYQLDCTATGPDGADVGAASTGFVFDPTSEELRQLNVDRDVLSTLADETGGEIIEANSLSSFVSTLAERNAPITQTKVTPLWHNWIVMLVAILLLVAEWGLRRWKGLP